MCFYGVKGTLLCYVAFLFFFLGGGLCPMVTSAPSRPLQVYGIDNFWKYGPVSRSFECPARKQRKYVQLRQFHWPSVGLRALQALLCPCESGLRGRPIRSWMQSAKPSQLRKHPRFHFTKGDAKDVDLLRKASCREPPQAAPPLDHRECLIGELGQFISVPARLSLTTRSKSSLQLLPSLEESPCTSAAILLAPVQL